MCWTHCAWLALQLPAPREVRSERSYRAHRRTASHLHTFRHALFDHLAEDVTIDPETSDY